MCEPRFSSILLTRESNISDKFMRKVFQFFRSTFNAYLRPKSESKQSKIDLPTFSYFWPKKSLLTLKKLISKTLLSLELPFLANVAIFLSHFLEKKWIKWVKFWIFYGYFWELFSRKKLDDYLAILWLIMDIFATFSKSSSIFFLI